MIIDLRKKVKSNFQKYFLQFMNNKIFGKTIENVRKPKNVKPAATERRRNYLISEPNYYAAKCFTENSLYIII